MTNSPGYPPPQQPGYPQGQPYYPQPGYGPPGPGFGGGRQPGFGVAPPPPPSSRRGAGARVLGCLGVLLLVVVAIAIKVGLRWGAKETIDHATGSPDIASVGDCVDKNGTESIKVVSCTGARYKVLGKVEDQTEVGFELDRELTMCTKNWPDTETGYWRGRKLGSGYVLCLGPVK